MRKLNNTLLGGILALALLAASATPGLSTKAFAQTATGRNVIFISIGDMRNWTGYNGNYAGTIHTPNIDTLAAQSTRFLNAYTTAPHCVGSRVSVMYGLSPATSGVTSSGLFSNPAAAAIHSDPLLQSLPEVMSANGYHTAVTGTMFHGDYPDKWDEPGPAPYSPLETILDPGPDGTGFNPLPLPEGETHVDQVRADWAGLFIANYTDPAPFFLAIDFTLPHIPWIIPQWAYDLYSYEDIVTSTPIANDLDDVPAQAVLLANTYPLFSVSSLTLYETVEAAGKAHDYTHAYLAAISHTDAMIGEVLAALAVSPYADNTDIILWSDHGFHLGEKFHWGKLTLWEQSLRVPLLIKSSGNPNYPAGDVVRNVSTLDLAPTVLDLAGLPSFTQFEGLPLHNPLNPNPVKAYLNKGRATIGNNWKVIDYDITRSDPADVSAYKLPIDPGEEINRIDEYRSRGC